MTDPRKRELRVLLLIILVGLGLRYAQTAANFVIARDSTDYLSAAIAFEDQGGGAFKESLRQPLYPLTLWAAGRAADVLWGDFAWRGDQMARVGRLLGVFLYVPFLLAAWFLFRRILDAGLAAGCLLVVVCHPLFGGYFANVLSETLYLTFFMAGLGCLVEAARAMSTGARAGKLWALAAGALSALAYLTRVEGQILLISMLSCILAGIAARRLQKQPAKWRRRVAVASCSLGGFLAPALPVMLYMGATSRRYSWEWLWRRLSSAKAALLPADGGFATAGLNLVASPLQSVHMLAATLIDKAPLITLGAIAGGVMFAVRRWRGKSAGDSGAGSRAVMVTLIWYAAAIVAGVSLQNGTVSLRYVQPLILMTLLITVKFADTITGGALERALMRKESRTVIAVAASIACFATFAEASARWERSKTGYRDAGLAIRQHIGSQALLTSSSRLAFYADAPNKAVDLRELQRRILEGHTQSYEFVVLETKRFTERELALMTGALSARGFGRSPWLYVRESHAASHAGRRILVFQKGGELE